MKRILHVVNSLNINAGQMSVAMNYYRHINRENIQFDFLYFQELPEDHKEEITRLGGKYYTFGKPSFWGQYQKQLDCFFREHKGEYIAVHCHPIWAAEIIANAAKRNGVNHIIAHSHSTKFSDKKISAIRNRIMVSFIGFFATDFIACSPEARYLFGRKRVEKNQILILRNAIECERFKYRESARNEIRASYDIDDDTTIIGNVGRLCIQKNQAFLLNIFKEYLYIDPNAKLLIVGDGELRENLIHKVEELNITQNVIFAGKQKDVGAYLSAMDIFVMPSLFEGAPVSAIEAQANGLNCLMSDTITKSVQLKLGEYCSIEKSVSTWAKAIQEILKRENTIRDDYRALVDAGFDISKEATKLEKYYVELLENE